MIGSAIGAGLAIWGAIQARKARKRAQAAERIALKERQRLSDKYAAEEIDKSHKQADLIRFKAVKLRGIQMAQQASSGVVVGNGSAHAITERTMVLAEADALVAIEDGKNKAQRIKDKSKYDTLSTGYKIDAMAQDGKTQMIQTASRVASSFG